MDENKKSLFSFKNIPVLKRKKADENREDDAGKTLGNIGIVGGLSDTVKKQTEEAAQKFAKPSKYTRSLIDDGAAKERIKREAFKGNAEVRDPYTDDVLCLKKSEARIEYGDDWTKHAAEADHKVSLEHRYEQTKNKPWLTNDDVKKSSNSSKNLEVVSRKFNNAKRKKSNTEFVNDEEYLKKTGVELSPDGKAKAIQTEKQAQRELNVQDFKDSAKNLVQTGHKAGVKAAKSGAIIGGGMSAIRNVVSIVKGEKDAGEAILDTAKDTAGAAALSYGTGAIGTTIAHSLSYSSNPLLSTLSKTNLPSQIAVAVLETGKTMKKYICGEIDGTECMTELGEKGTGMIAASCGAAVGQIMIPVPILGGMVGSMVGYVFSSSYYNELVTIMQNRKLAHEERLKIEAECREAIAALKQYRREIERVAEEYFAEYTMVFQNAFSTIDSSLMVGDTDGVISGANMITEKLGGKVQYNNMAEFDEFMNDENSDFIL